LTTPKWIFASAIGLSSCAALADRVVLDNGDRLSGSIVSMEADALLLETAYAGKIRLPRARLVQIETDAAVRVRLSDGTELDGQLQAAEPGQLSIRIGSLAQTESLGFERIAAINPPRNPDKTVLSGRAALGGSFASGNTDAQTLHLDGELVARNPIQRITLGGELNEASQDREDTASNWRIGLKYDHFVRERTYLYANTRFDHDGQADLELRSTLGVGGGRQFYDRDDLRLALEGGLSLVNEDYRNAADLSFPGARLALKYQQALWQKKLTLFHTGDLLLSLDSFDDYLYLSRTGVRLPVGNGFSLGAQVTFDYDAIPAVGKETTDTALIVNLNYSH